MMMIFLTNTIRAKIINKLNKKKNTCVKHKVVDSDERLWNQNLKLCQRKHDKVSNFVEESLLHKKGQTCRYVL